MVEMELRSKRNEISTKMGWGLEEENGWVNQDYILTQLHVKCVTFFCNDQDSFLVFDPLIWVVLSILMEVLSARSAKRTRGGREYGQEQRIGTTYLQSWPLLFGFVFPALYQVGLPKRNTRTSTPDQYHRTTTPPHPPCSLQSSTGAYAHLFPVPPPPRSSGSRGWPTVRRIWSRFELLLRLDMSLSRVCRARCNTRPVAPGWTLAHRRLHWGRLKQWTNRKGK